MPLSCQALHNWQLHSARLVYTMWQLDSHTEESGNMEWGVDYFPLLFWYYDFETPYDNNFDKENPNVRNNNNNEINDNRK